ncbi:Zn(2)-C6 fungal-type domain-containing protein [Fusarium falciforme]|uniref:Zn(2)-C6 fungal-type domain-containing protein n=1 Tax=Fusarium falciforme TaxID=195108 RepID=UPI0023015C97|nr:Zn(2)-C6 fungal-type domain-containing protein [Fusarium falciforme]WAO91717.1 Zn(2)-C6 fungal-type domain-containing protein [Fusarium falciforme]
MDAPLSNPGPDVTRPSIQSTNPVRWASSRRSRVCDRCIRQKIKCDLNQPCCSACDAYGHTCSYSRTRKKPGPIRGSSRRPGRPASAASPTASSSDSQDITVINESFGVTWHIASTPEATGEPNPTAQPLNTLSDAAKTLNTFSSQLSEEARHELAHTFASTVNASFPLFPLHTFPTQLRGGEVSEGLASIVYAISAKLTGATLHMDLDAALSSLVESSTAETSSISKPNALNEWRAACLLAWYGFYQYQGQKIDDCISNLARKAYHIGLHQIDSLSNVSTFGWDLLSEAAAEEWRHVWWSIYLLDTHLSYSTATPSQIQPDSIGTALLRGDLTRTTASARNGAKTLIPTDQADLWKVIQEIVTVNGRDIFGLHIAVNALLKEAIAVHRRGRQNPRYPTQERISELEDCLCGIRLSLPFNYLRMVRDVAGGESVASYHCRLLTILKLQSTQMMLGLPGRQVDEAQFQANWRENLETCHRLFEIISHWDKECVFAVDPELCIIVMGLLVLFHLHNKASGISNPSSSVQLTRLQDILRVILQKHARQWKLAQILLDSYDALVTKISEPLGLDDLFHVIDQFQGPLHLKWANFVRPDHDAELRAVGRRCLDSYGSSVGYAL